MTKLYFFNMFVFQFLFFRLGKLISLETKEVLEWRLMFFIIPCSGWKKDFVYIGKPKYFTLWIKNAK